MFLDYRKPSKELVIDLINRDNPNLPFPITYENCNIVSPVAVNDPSVFGFRNTEATIVPHDNVNWRGGTKIAYRRLEAKDLFPGGRVLFGDYVSSATISKEVYLEAINNDYGTKLTLEEISSSDIQSTIHDGNLSFSTSCLAFSGLIPYSRLKAPIPLGIKLPNILPDWAPCQEDGGKDYTPVLYGVDFTPFDHLIEGAGNTFQNVQFASPLIDVMNLYSSVKFGPSSTRPLDSSTVRATIYDLPSSENSLLLANVQYSKVMVITPANGNSWLKGAMYLHYDRDVL